MQKICNRIRIRRLFGRIAIPCLTENCDIVLPLFINTNLFVQVSREALLAVQGPLPCAAHSRSSLENMISTRGTVRHIPRYQGYFYRRNPVYCLWSTNNPPPPNF